MLRSAIGLPVAGSQSRTTLAVVLPFRSSSPATARTFPSGEKARLWSKQVGPLRVNRSSPVATSHNFTFGSSPALAAARVLPSGENATARTRSGDLPKVASSFPVSTSHTLAVQRQHCQGVGRGDRKGTGELRAVPRPGSRGRRGPDVRREG